MKELKRILTALTTASIAVCGIIFLPPVVTTAALTVLVALVHFEYSTMIAKKHEIMVVPGVVVGLFALCAVWVPDVWQVSVGGCDLEDLLVYGFLAAFAFLWLRTLFGRAREPSAALANTLLGIVYIPLMLIPLVLLIAPGEMPPCACDCGGELPGWTKLLYVIAVVKFSDMGGFAFGKTIGRHKLCPDVSPNKTWEGLAGSLTAGVIMSLSFLPLTHFSPVKAISLGLVGAAVGTFGDLVESRIKREVGVKDSATFMPAGLGGFLDMFDSLVFVPAVFSRFL